MSKGTSNTKMESVRNYLHKTLSPKVSLRRWKNTDNAESLENMENLGGTSFSKFRKTPSIKIFFNKRNDEEEDFFSFTDHEAYKKAFNQFLPRCPLESEDQLIKYQTIKLFKSVFRVDSESNFECKNEADASITNDFLKKELIQIKDYVSFFGETTPNNKPMINAFKYLGLALKCIEIPESYIIADENIGKVGRHAMQGYDKGGSNIEQKLRCTQLILFGLIMRMSYMNENKTYLPFDKLNDYVLDIIGTKMLLMVDKLLTDVEEIKHFDNQTSWNEMIVPLFMVNSICQFSFPFIWITIKSLLIAPYQKADVIYAVNFIPEGQENKVLIALSKKLTIFLWKEYDGKSNENADPLSNWSVYSEIANEFIWNGYKIKNMETFFEHIVSKSPDEIERMRLFEMPFLMNVCRDGINDMFLHKACKNDSTFWVKRFLTKSNSGVTGSDGKTLLHMACESGNLAMINTLLDFVDLDTIFDVRDDNMYTPIEYAAVNLDASLIIHLFENSEEKIKTNLLIKFPSILTCMMMCNKSDDEILEATKAVMTSINLLRIENQIYEELTNKIGSMDSDNFCMKPITKQYINNVLKLWYKPDE